MPLFTLDSFIERLGTVAPEGDIFHEQRILPFVRMVIGVFHRSGQGLTVQQIQDDLPGFFELLRNSQKQRPRGLREYHAVAVYTADGFDQTVIDWVHDHGPRYGRHTLYEVVLYDRIRNAAETREKRVLGDTHDPVLNGVLPTAVESLARREGHAKVEQVNSNSMVRQPGDPALYGFCCTYEGSGAIYEAGNMEPLWRFTGQEGRRERYPYGFFHLPDFVVYDPDKRERFRFKRVRRLPMARFIMIEDGRPICTISQRSPLLNRYRLDFTSGERWSFHMPPFTIYFKGWSATGGKVFVRLDAHNTWHLQIDEGHDSPQLLAALAFIHRERLRCV
jgi:hypothetical protein